MQRVGVLRLEHITDTWKPCWNTDSWPHLYGVWGIQCGWDPRVCVLNKFLSDGWHCCWSGDHVLFGVRGRGLETRCLLAWGHRDIPYLCVFPSIFCWMSLMATCMARQPCRRLAWMSPQYMLTVPSVGASGGRFFRDSLITLWEKNKEKNKEMYGLTELGIDRICFGYWTLTPAASGISLSLSSPSFCFTFREGLLAWWQRCPGSSSLLSSLQPCPFCILRNRAVSSWDPCEAGFF